MKDVITGVAVVLCIGACDRAEPDPEPLPTPPGAASGALAATPAGRESAPPQPARVTRQEGQNFTLDPGGELQISGGDTIYDIILPTDVLFDFDRSELRPEAADTLAKVKQHLEANKVTQLHVKGHTDSKGEERYNLVLSQKRAVAVCDWLKREVPSVRGLTNCMGFGEREPLAPNENPDGGDNPLNRQKNRRVVLAVVAAPDVNAMIAKAQAQAAEARGRTEAAPN